MAAATNDVPAALGLTAGETEVVLETAAMAPSVHNTQPWAFRVTADTVELHADRSRRLAVADPRDQELHLACGAALYNLCLAVRERGVRPAVTLFPDPGRPDLVAGVRHGGRAPAPQDRWVLRDFTGGAGPARVAGKDFEDEPMIAVLVTHSTGATAEVRAGEALQRVLLTATAAGLATSFLSQLIEVPEAREAVRELVTAVRPPQAVLRIGRGDPAPRTPRRPVADLLAGPSPTP